MSNSKSEQKKSQGTRSAPDAELDRYVPYCRSVCDVRVQGFRKAFTHAANHCGCRVIRFRPDPKAGGNWIEATMSLKSSVRLGELGDAQRLGSALCARIGCQPMTWCIQFRTTARKVVMQLHMPGWVVI